MVTRITTTIRIDRKIKGVERIADTTTIAGATTEKTTITDREKIINVGAMKFNQEVAITYLLTSESGKRAMQFTNLHLKGKHDE